MGRLSRLGKSGRMLIRYRCGRLYINDYLAAFSACSDITPRRILDRLELALAGDARHVGFDGRAVLLLEPLQPVGPPASFVLGRAVDEGFQGPARQIVDPILVLVRRWRVDHTSDVPGARKHE